MKLVTVTLPEREIVVGTWPRKTEVLPEIDHTYAPTLAAIHNWIYGDYGPLYWSWHDGWLCPFHTSINQRNMRCVSGSRGVRKCSGIGLLADDHISHYTTRRRRQLRGRVVCYSWCHRLGHAYWDFLQDHQDEILAIPDEQITFATVLILRNVYRNSGWIDWRRELDLRKKHRKYERPWLKGLKAGNMGARR